MHAHTHAHMDTHTHMHTQEHPLTQKHHHWILCVDSGVYLVDGWASLLLFGGSVEAPERRKPAPSLACRPGHGLSTPSHSNLTSPGCHLGFVKTEEATGLTPVP